MKITPDHTATVIATGAPYTATEPRICGEPRTNADIAGSLTPAQRTATAALACDLLKILAAQPFAAEHSPRSLAFTATEMALQSTEVLREYNLLP